MPFHNGFKILQHPALNEPLVWQTKSSQLQDIVAETAYDKVASPAKWSLLQAVVDTSGELNILYLESTNIKDIAAIENLSNEILQKLMTIPKRAPEALRVSHAIITFDWLDTIALQKNSFQQTLGLLKNYFENPTNAVQHNQKFFVSPDPIKQAEWLRIIDQIASEPSQQERVRLAQQLKQEWTQHILAVNSQVEFNEKARQHNQEICAKRNATISSCLTYLYQKYKQQLGENARLALLTSIAIPQQVFVIGQGIQVQHQVINSEQQAIVLSQNELTLRVATDNAESRPHLVLGKVKNTQEFKFELLPFEEELAQFDVLMQQAQYQTINHHAAALHHLIIEQKNAYLSKQSAFYQARLYKYNKARAAGNKEFFNEKYPDTELRWLEEILNKTNAYLKEPTEANYLTYKAFVKTLPGHSVLWQQIAGAMLILAGVVLAAACGVMIAASHGVALPVAVPVVSQAATWVAAGSALLLTGLGIFACNKGREKGLAKAAHSFAKVVPLQEGLPVPQDRQRLLGT